MASNQRFRPYVGPKKSQPAHISDPPEGEATLEQWSDERESGGAHIVVPHSAPGIDDSEEGRANNMAPWEKEKSKGRDDREEDDEDDDEVDWTKRAQDAFRTSTDFFDSNYRKQLEDSLRAFNNQHSSDSKYNSETFKKRSNLFRPKTRTVMRKNEAALCAALFSNLDLIEVTAANPSEAEEIASADTMQQVLQERLTVTMPWYKFSIGSMQDAQNQGLVICHSYWKYSGYMSKAGKWIVKDDKPVQELVAMENFRFDPSAAWYDIVNTSPYLIHLIPMYVGDVLDRMRYPDAKGQKWKRYTKAEIASCTETSDESTRYARTNMSQDAAQQPREVTDYDVVWVHRHIHRHRGEDYEFYMLGSKYMLTEAEPLTDNVWFGERPYVIGCAVLETHKAAPSSLATLIKPLQDEANDIDNMLTDNMKFILNKGHLVRRGANVDTGSLVRNVPGRVTMVNDIEKDVKELNWPDLPQSAFEQKNRNDADLDSLAGSFNPMTLQQSRTPRESFRTLNAVQSPAMMMTEYTLMTLVQTFLLPVLRQLVLLEQYYETDQVLLSIAGKKAQIMQRFGVNQVTDAILEKKMAVNVNLGMGATDPSTKQQRLNGALMTYSQLCAKPAPGLDLKEVGKELFALAGYRDAMRFFGDADPEKAKMQMMIKKLMEEMTKLKIDKNNKHEANVVKLVTSREKNMADLLKAGKEDEHESRHLLVGHLLEMEKADKQAEQQRSLQAEGAMQGQVAQAQGASQQQQLAKMKPAGKPQ